MVEAAAYHTLYGNTDWDGDDATLDNAMLTAMRSLELLYGPRLVGYRLSATQDLSFPRYMFTDHLGKLHTQSSIPSRIKEAQFELALMHLMGTDLFPEENQSTGIAQESVKVGDIQTSTTYTKQAKKSTFDGFRKIDITLYPLLKVNGPILAFSR